MFSFDTNEGLNFMSGNNCAIDGFLSWFDVVGQFVYISAVSFFSNIRCTMYTSEDTRVQVKLTDFFIQHL